MTRRSMSLLIAATLLGAAGVSMLILVVDRALPGTLIP